MNTYKVVLTEMRTYEMNVSAPDEDFARGKAWSKLDVMRSEERETAELNYTFDCKSIAELIAENVEDLDK